MDRFAWSMHTGPASGHQARRISMRWSGSGCCLRVSARSASAPRPSTTRVNAHGSCMARASNQSDHHCQVGANGWHSSRRSSSLRIQFAQPGDCRHSAEPASLPRLPAGHRDGRIVPWRLSRLVRASPRDPVRGADNPQCRLSTAKSRRACGLRGQRSPPARAGDNRPGRFRESWTIRRCLTSARDTVTPVTGARPPPWGYVRGSHKFESISLRFEL